MLAHSLTAGMVIDCDLTHNLGCCRDADISQASLNLTIEEYAGLRHASFMEKTLFGGS